MWQSKRVKRVVKSTMASETLMMVEAAEASFWIRDLFNEILKVRSNMYAPIQCIIDNHQLYDAIFSIRQILDKRLRIDIAILREMV